VKKKCHDFVEKSTLISDRYLPMCRKHPLHSYSSCKTNFSYCRLWHQRSYHLHKQSSS